jgi:Cu+-exporting ATPase
MNNKKECHSSSSGNNKKQNLKEGQETAWYVCPMHSEVRQKGPGDCSICGMALEPEVVVAQKGENKELADFRWRFIVGLFFAAPVVALEMGGHLFNLNHFLSGALSNWLQLLFTTPIVVWVAFPFFKKGWRSLLNRSLNMFTLIAMGVGVAFVYSIIATVFPQIFPASFRGAQGEVAVYFEAACVIVILVLLGQILELKARERTSGAIKKLLGLQPKTALRITKEGEQEVALEMIQQGDRLRIHPGEKIPVDGVVIEGKSNVDESMITGEPGAVLKIEGVTVIAGTVNENGALIIQTEKVGQDTMLAHIIEMVAKAQRSRAPIERLVDIVSAWFVPVVILIAIVSFILWVLLLPSQGLSYGLIAAVSSLIIACPCALGLATPMSIMVGVGRGAQLGVLIKDAESLESLEKVDTVIVDKTGTLTEGKPALVSIVSIATLNEKELLTVCAALEKSSEHSLAQALIQAAKEQNIDLPQVSQFEAIPGKGIKGIVEGKDVVVGNSKLMVDLAMDFKTLEQEAEQLREKGATVIFVAVENKMAGLIAVADPIKKSTKEAIEKLKNTGLTLVMLTGDNSTTAHAVAKELAIEQVYADVLPADKYKIVQEYQAKGAIVAMAGDGINDAPALAAANVGIAMGAGTDVAIESAGVTLIKGDLRGIVRGITLSRAVMSNIRQNLFFAFFYNAIGVPIAAGILYPSFGILLSPIFAAVAMSLSSVSVILNALRLNIQKI